MTSATQETTSRFGQFELLEEIGHGGMATVHRAELRGMDGFRREVVIKRILPELASDDHFKHMFIEEAKLSALLNHPNIVQVYDFGEIDSSYYLSMEFIDGITLTKLRKFLRRNERHFDPGAVALIFQQVCQGLDYTHDLSRDGKPLGLVHRDISPSNVMVARDGAVKLLDFGIAKAVEVIDEELTRTGTLKGKWSYMAPEQVFGAPLTNRTDIFATGIVLWEMLTGLRLFKAKTDFLTLSNVAKAEVPLVTSVRPELPPLFNDICRKALARDPSERYATAELMADDLEEILGECPFTTSALVSLVGPALSAQDAARVRRQVRMVRDAEAPEGGEDISGEGEGELVLKTGTGTESDCSVDVSGESNNSGRSNSTIHNRSGGSVSISVPLAGGDHAFLPAPQRRNTGIWLAAGAVLMCAGIVGAILFILNDRNQATAENGAPNQAKNALRIEATSEPEGAEVYLLPETRPRGRTPLILTLRDSTADLTLRFTHPGYLPLEQRVAPRSQERVRVTLEPQKKNAAPAPLPSPTNVGSEPSRPPRATPNDRAPVPLTGRPSTDSDARSSSRNGPRAAARRHPRGARPPTASDSRPRVREGDEASVARPVPPPRDNKQQVPNLKSGELADPFE